MGLRDHDIDYSHHYVFLKNIQYSYALTSFILMVNTLLRAFSWSASTLYFYFVPQSE